MDRVLKFDGPKAADRFWLMLFLDQQGRQEGIRQSENPQSSMKRTKDDVFVEADFDELIEPISAAYAEAKAFGTIPKEIQDAVEKLRGIDEPTWASGEPMRFLKPSDPAPELALGVLTTYKQLMANVERAIPKSSPRHARQVKDLMTFLESADKREKGS